MHDHLRGFPGGDALLVRGEDERDLRPLFKLSNCMGCAEDEGTLDRKPGPKRCTGLRKRPLLEEPDVEDREDREVSLEER